MALSARNQLTGTVTSIARDGLMAEVTVDVGASAPVVAVITRSSAESLGLAEGSPVTVVIKSTAVMLATGD
jgi:molybdate transport system regulatory protein